MSDIAVRVEGLSKEYRIGLRVEKYKTLRDSIAALASAPVRLFRRRAREGGDEQLWALRDVNFDVQAGEVVGIIGRNGAGKSTLLKILARITDPTHGLVEIHGRVGSLLEVGTGFHPELTGRENIYLNGAILGMRRAEIERKFDEIVAFSEVEKFIDTPVKRYSSGMYLRLAFAVAAHLEPEILLVDEVLAVGDADFQKKCLGKMGDVAQEGRTVLFVSHNMPAVQALCARAILLRKGSVAFDGSTGEVLREYLGHLQATAARAFTDNPERRGDGSVRLTGARVLDAEGRPCERVVAGTPITLEFAYENRIGAERFDLMLAIVNHLGIGVTHISTQIAGFSIAAGSKGLVTCRIPNLPLPHGEYRVVAVVKCQGRNTDHIPNALAFSVESSVFFSTGRVPRIEHGACLMAHEWEHREGLGGGGFGRRRRDLRGLSEDGSPERARRLFGPGSGPADGRGPVRHRARGSRVVLVRRAGPVCCATSARPAIPGWRAWRRWRHTLASRCGSGFPSMRCSRETFESSSAIWSAWYSRVKNVPLELEVREPAGPEPTRTGAFFSGGIDSFYTVLRHAGGYLRPDDLILIRGFDFPLAFAREFDDHRGRMGAVAESLGMELVDIATNLRETRLRLAPWATLWHGSALASAGLALERRYRYLLVASSSTYGELDAYGSHPMTDILHSTSTSRILHDGADATRLDKVGFVAGSELALRNLHVCFRETSGRNCGRCRKCLLAMIGLMLSGVGDRCPAFAPGLDLERVRRILFTTEGQRHGVRRLRTLAERQGRSDVVRALDEALRRSARRAPAFRWVQKSGRIRALRPAARWARRGLMAGVVR